MSDILGIERSRPSVVVKMLESEDKDCCFRRIGKAQDLLLDLACQLVAE
jgi:hypothetical protein